MSLVVLCENEYFLAVHKPQGLTFHSEDDAQGMVAKVQQQFGGNIQGRERLYPVHRLDRMTSGIMLFAKTTEVNSALSALFAEKRIEKYYLALSEHKPKKKQGAIAGDMAKARGGSYKLLRSLNNPARTRFFSQTINIWNGQGVWAFILKPESGKTHQLRVALKSLGSPIIGDRRYGGRSADRGYLHAYRIRFDLFGKRFEITDHVLEGELFSSAEHTKQDPVQVHSTKSEQNSVVLSGLPETWMTPESLAWPKGAFLLPP